MAGQFSKTARPKRPGAYFNFTAREAEPILVNTLGTVAIPFTHTWGPSETVVELGSFGDFLAVFGQGGTTPPAYTEGYKAVVQAFQGEGLPGRGGAGAVLAYRMTGSGAAKASKTLQNTTPAAALTLTAKYEGTYGHNITLQVQDNAQSSANNDLIVRVEGVEVERFTYADTNITALAADINANSDWVVASGVTSGTALAIVGPTALTGGNDGATVAAQDYTDFMAAIEPFRFSLLAPANLNDSSILTSLVSWAQTANSRGKRFMTVVGGGSDGTPDTVSAAVTRSAAINDPNFVNLGGGVYTDARLGTLHPSTLAPRIAGILARRGERESLTFARLAGVSISTGVTESQILSAIDSGVVTFARDSHPDAPVRVEKGLTTFTDKADANRPFNVYSVPKFVRTMHAIEVELTEFAEMNVIGRLPVNDATRAYIVGATQARLAAREADGVIQAGWSVTIDGDPPPTDTDDFVALLYAIRFGRSLEQVYNTVVVG
jgi:hypothetical protein